MEKSQFRKNGRAILYIKTYCDCIVDGSAVQHDSEILVGNAGHHVRGDAAVLRVTRKPKDGGNGRDGTIPHSGQKGYTEVKSRIT